LRQIAFDASKRDAQLVPGGGAEGLGDEVHQFEAGAVGACDERSAAGRGERRPREVGRCEYGLNIRVHGCLGLRAPGTNGAVAAASAPEMQRQGS
jgi:hypothetical protein